MRQWLVRSLTAAFVLATVLMPGAVRGGEIEVEQDIEYRSVDGQSLQLNIARPQEPGGPRPCLVWIHGGGWAEGGREEFQESIEESARRGFVAATISYRLTDATQETPAGKNPFPAQIHDCKAAIRWLRSNAEKYHIDPDHIGVIGTSAGGHLSLLVGLTDAKDGLEGTAGDDAPSSRVQAVVNLFGPTDLVSQYEGSPDVRFLIEAFCGGTPQSAAKQCKQASPITYLTKDDPPILTFHGTTDELVPVQQAKLLAKRCSTVGVPHTLVIFDGQGHGFDEEHNQKMAEQSFKFFSKHLGAPK